MEHAFDIYKCDANRNPKNVWLKIIVPVGTPQEVIDNKIEFNKYLGYTVEMPKEYTAEEQMARYGFVDTKKS